MTCRLQSSISRLLVGADRATQSVSVVSGVLEFHSSCEGRLGQQSWQSSILTSPRTSQPSSRQSESRRRTTSPPLRPCRMFWRDSRRNRPGSCWGWSHQFSSKQNRATPTTMSTPSQKYIKYFERLLGILKNNNNCSTGRAGLPWSQKLLRSVLLSRASTGQLQQHQSLPCQPHQVTSRTLPGNWRIFTSLSLAHLVVLSARTRLTLRMSRWVGLFFQSENDKSSTDFHLHWRWVSGGKYVKHDQRWETSYGDADSLYRWGITLFTVWPH